MAVVLRDAWLEIAIISRPSVWRCSESDRMNFWCRIHPSISHVKFRLFGDV